MTTTPNLGQSTWDPGNAQPDLLYNALLSTVDALVPTPCVNDKDLTAPPGSPAPGSLYIVASPATGLWVGKEGNLAAYTYANAWMFFPPQDGWLVRVLDEDADYRYNGSAWNLEAGGGGIPDAPSDGTTYGRKDNAWVDVGSGVAGVSSVNGVSGAVSLVAGANVTITEDSSGALTFASTGGGGSASTFHGGFTDPTTEEGDLIVRKATIVTELSILFIGDSITSGQLVTTAPVGPCATDLSLGAVTVTGVNQGVPGSTSANWVPGQTNYVNAVAAGAAAGSRIAHIMLGTNDSGGPVSEADYRAHMIDLCGGLVALGYIVVVSYPPYAPDHITAVTSYCRAIDSLVDNFHVFQGDTQAQDYFRDNPSQLQPDNIHPTQAGSNALAGLWADAMLAVVNGLTNETVLQRAQLGGVMRLDTSGDVASLTSATLLRVPFIGAITNTKRRVAIPFGLTIQGWEILADVSGSLVIDVQAGPYSGYPTAASICGGDKPSITSGIKGKSSDVSAWTADVADDSFLLLNVDSVTTIADFEFVLLCQYGVSSAPPPPGDVTWNPADKGSTIALSTDKLTASQVGFTFQSVRATDAIEASGAASYFLTTVGASGSQTVVGVMTSAADISNFVGNDAFGWGAYGNDGGSLHSGSHATYGATFGTSGDEILFLLKNGKIYWRLNGTWQGSGDPVAETGYAFTGLSGPMFPAVSMLNTGQSCVADFSTVDPDAALAGCTPWQT